jgi:hypothetical protein
MSQEEPPVIDEPKKGIDLLQGQFLSLLNEVNLPEQNPVLLALFALLYNKHLLSVMYKIYGDAFTGLMRDGLFKHFKTHAKDERNIAYELTRKLVSLGQVIEFPPLVIPPFDPFDKKAMEKAIRHIADLELQSIQLWTQLDQVAKNDLALQGFAQDGAVLDTAHREDMLRYLGDSHA